MNFSIGQKVVCVDDSPSKAHGYVCLVRKGSVYVVKECIAASMPGFCRDGVKLIGDPQDYPYAVDRFRALEELKQEAADRQQLEVPIHVR